jgi:hypothetical protein
VVKSLIRIVCALLLFAQYSALTHAVWHAHHQLPSQQYERLDGAGTHSPYGPGVSSLCALDEAFGQVLGAAAGTLQLHTGAATAGETPLHWQQTLAFQQFLAPLSRGPPSLL